MRENLGHRFYELPEKREKAELGELRERWKLQTSAMIEQERFRRMVIPQLVELMLQEGG